MIHTDYFLFCFKISSSQSYSQHFCSDNSCETLECNESVLALTPILVKLDNILGDEITQ